MVLEIERKFLPKKLPNLSKIIPVYYERYILFSQDGIELRIQRKDNLYELERKVESNTLTRETQIIPLSLSEFNLLKQLSVRSIIRESYLIQENPEITLKLYRGDYEGLERIEVTFDSEESARAFVMPDWFGVEITESPLGRDGKLTQLSRNEFLSQLNKLKDTI